MTFSNMSYSVKSLKNTALKERITFVDKRDFVPKRKEFHIKSKLHLNLNTNAMNYFKSYEENHRKGGSLRFFFFTLTLNQQELYKLNEGQERYNQLQSTYEHIIWYVNKGLGIKKPSTTKTHKHKVVHSYIVCEDITRNGHSTLEHLHSIVAVHPSHSKTIDKDFFKKAIGFNGGLSIVDDLKIEEIPIHYGIKQKWDDVRYLTDYINKSATLPRSKDKHQRPNPQLMTTDKEIFAYNSPPTPTENPYENRNTKRPLGTLDGHLTRTRNLNIQGFQF